MQDAFEFIGQTLRDDKAHHKDSDLHRNPCPQTIYGPGVLSYFLTDMGVAFGPYRYTKYNTD